MRRTLRIFIAWCAVASMVVAGSVATSRELVSCAVTVQLGESVQAAIDAAPPGAVIYLPAGDWHEHLTIDKSLILQGEGADITTIHGRLNGIPVVRMRSPDQGETVVLLSDMTVLGAMTRDVPESGGPGLLIDDGVQAVITGCALGQNTDGLLLMGASRATIVGCTLSGNCPNVMTDDTGYGIGLFDSSQAVIVDSIASGNWTGIGIADSAEAQIVGCTVRENHHGIALAGHARAAVAGCTVSDSYTIWMDPGPNVYGEGILVAGSSQAEITNCAVSGNYRAIRIGPSARATITTSSVTDNEEGIWMFGSAEVTLRDNDVLCNGHYEIALDDSVCSLVEGGLFTGRVTGSANRLVSPCVPYDYWRGRPVCPVELEFLMTQEGGELDRRVD